MSRRTPDPEPATAKVDFNEYAGSYESDIASATSFVKQDPAFFLEVKAKALLQVLAHTVGEPTKARLLDVGCGNGELDRFLIPHVGELSGVDLSRQMVGRAARANPSGSFAVYDGGRLPFDDSSFELAFASCVLHHVPKDDWTSFAAELARVVRPGGVGAIIEHNPVNPLTRLVVSRCAFDADAVLLSSTTAGSLLREQGLEDVTSSYLLFFPWRGQVLRSLEHALRRVPLGAQYLAFARRPAGESPDGRESLTNA